MKDLITEIWESIRRNKLRTCLTGFAVSWGIFMLIVLLGAGNGVRNAFNSQANDVATNTVQVGGGRTSEPYAGYRAGRRIRLTEDDMTRIKESFPDIVDDVTSTTSISLTFTYRDVHVSGGLDGNFPSRKDMDKIVILHGRYINDADIKQKRKVVVLPENVAEKFLDNPNIPAERMIGKSIKAGKLNYKVVGIMKSDETSTSVWLPAPYTTVRDVYARGQYIDELTFSFHGLDTEEAHEQFEDGIHAVLNARHKAAPDDRSAVWIWNRFTQNLQMNKAGNILNKALWIVGLFTLLGGIVGVSNIMLITVKERTHEFGIRKAIGASPWNITKLIISESVIITAFFGYIGMVLGMIACDILDKTLGHSSQDIMGMTIKIMENPTVGFDVAIEATIVLIIAGTVAGLIPALKASKVKPIEALRAE